jgi:Na+-transporting NADH:ubiquinone oxidoreductase subunit C
MVLAPDMSRVMNIQFLDQKETPGLGARIEEGWFVDQFKGVPIAWDQPVDKRIIVGQAPNPAAKNRVDAITGATQTSLALMRFLNSELETFRKAIKEWREEQMLEIPSPWK